eukprot:144227-Prorocentrum_minimum.AAC.2
MGLWRLGVLRTRGLLRSHCGDCNDFTPQKYNSTAMSIYERDNGSADWSTLETCEQRDKAP